MFQHIIVGVSDYDITYINIGIYQYRYLIYNIIGIYNYQDLSICISVPVSQYGCISICSGA